VDPPLTPHAKLAARQQHRPEGRLAEPSRIDADRAVQLIRDRASRGRLPDDAREAGKIREAD